MTDGRDGEKREVLISLSATVRREEIVPIVIEQETEVQIY